MTCDISYKYGTFADFQNTVIGPILVMCSALQMYVNSGPVFILNLFLFELIYIMINYKYMYH